MVASELQRSVPGFECQSQYFKLNSEQKLHYIEQGEGEPMLMVHGNPTWSFYFRSLINHFKSRFNVIAVDHLGSGLSDKPSEAKYSLEDHIDRLESFVLGKKLNQIHLVVHDWGGAIGLGFAVRHPEKIKSITVLNSAAFWSKDVPKRIAMLRLPVLGEWAMRKLNAFALPATTMASFKGLSSEAKKGLLHPYTNYENRLGIARFVQDIPFTKRHKTFKTLQDIEAKLSTIDCPKQLIWGMKDFCFHRGFLARWRQIYPKASVREIADAGHYVLEDSPHEVIQAMDSFLRKNLAH